MTPVPTSYVASYICHSCRNTLIVYPNGDRVYRDETGGHFYEYLDEANRYIPDCPGPLHRTSPYPHAWRMSEDYINAMFDRQDEEWA